jgi:protein-tyrosine phosphatase
MDSGDYGRFDMIVVMDSQNLRNIRPFVHGDPGHKVRKLMSYAGKDTDVADPWYSGDFERTYQDVVEGCRGILRVLRTLG